MCSFIYFPPEINKTDPDRLTANKLAYFWNIKKS